jgi:hypothetical protein
VEDSELVCAAVVVFVVSEALLLDCIVLFLNLSKGF